MDVLSCMCWQSSGHGHSMCTLVVATAVQNSNFTPSRTKIGLRLADGGVKYLEVRVEEATGCNKDSQPTWDDDFIEGFVKGAASAADINSRA